MLNKYDNVGAFTSVTSLVAFSLIYIIVSIVGISNWTTLKASTQNHVSDIPVIIIDPGHGGDDGGALGFHGEKKKILICRFQVLFINSAAFPESILY